MEKSQCANMPNLGVFYVSLAGLFGLRSAGVAPIVILWNNHFPTFCGSSMWSMVLVSPSTLLHLLSI